ncbi:methyl-accepting chemotaxis protein [Agarilytica rhodophyticola]|uniref:methyl-accepting chemotaxis protein n=1 Tax=Agarilytica rhodophyticola TaxID=1737490 RepID=UPI001FE313B4|nr:methyl-accepting chemotaxis protein [Agarilytica rhodophyticola]
MFNKLKESMSGNSQECKELAAKMEAVNNTQAVIEFDTSGNILHANNNFLNTMGYRLDEVQGKHHSIFIDDKTRNSPEYQNFWQRLASGECFVSEFRRLGKNNKEVWIKASYNPLRDETGRPYKVVKFATDITDAKRLADKAKALELCQANVMLADNDCNIVYMNETVTEMLKKNESSLRKELPNFNVKSLIGTCVDDFHQRPEHQRGMLRNLREPYKTDLELGSLTFGLIATPWTDANGERIGTLVEWEDKTERVNREKKEREVAQENLRIRQALDVCDTSVMLANEDMTITYMNSAVREMMRNRENEIREQLPNFNSSQLLGTNVDIFHKNPSHQRNLLKSLTKSYRADLPLSGLTFGLIATPLHDEDGKFIGTVVEWNDKTEALAQQKEERRLAAENERVKQALDNVTANVMIADEDAHIIYMNKAVQGMMQRAESDIKKDLPSFDVSKLMGVNIDVFHKDPSHQRNLLRDMRGVFNGKAEVGGRTFTVIANPVYQDNERVGTVVEWNDRTAEMAMEREIDSVIAAASEGSFSQHISMDGKEGFFHNLSKGINNLVSTMEIALNDIVRMLGSIAKGNLNERITRDYQGSFGQLKNDANATAEKLTEVIANIRMSADSIGLSADEIAQGNADLSHRTESQASSLEETAASMEEMTAAVKQSAENAEKANAMTVDAQMLARDGGGVVENAVSAMEEINKSSKKISDIISVIDEIAFQTNLLALNAAVEAARAGEQGRGFAVVAGEVRNLAQRSAGAAKEIKDLIRDSVSKVEDGTSLVNHSGEVLAKIVTSVDEVTVMMQEIAGAAKEQSAGIEQVNTAITQMDEMTQQNAALVEEASAAGQAMSDQARSMKSVVEFFSHGDSLGGGGGAPAAAPVASAPASFSKTPSRPAASSSSTSHSSGSSGSHDEWEEF